MEQVRRLKNLKAKRKGDKVQQILKKIEKAANSKKSNLLQLSIEAAHLRCTVGEITQALEKVYGRHTLTTRTISGVYANSSKSNSMISEVKEVVDFLFLLHF